MKFTVSPGPSQLFEDVRRDITTAAETGVLEISHRSKEFSDISRKAVTQLRMFLAIPDDYIVLYFDSASHIWHSMVANAVEKKSFHFVNGAFSGKAREASKLLYKDVDSQETPWGEPVDVQNAAIAPDTELITICYNETSTGCKLLSPELSYLRNAFPDALLAVDTVSCAGAIPLAFRDADLWYFSVQKCFGMPSGLGILIMSPRAYEKSLTMMTAKTNLAGNWAWKHHVDMMRNDVYQTPQTPNVLNIFLMAEQLARLNNAGGVSAALEETIKKKLAFESFVNDNGQFTWFVQDADHRSDTVFTVAANSELILKAHVTLLEKGIVLGAGYGKAKADTFRIANFPAVSVEMMEEVMDILGTVE